VWPICEDRHCQFWFEYRVSGDTNLRLSGNDSRTSTFRQRLDTKYLRSKPKRKSKPSASVPNPQPLPPFPSKSNPGALSASASLADQNSHLPDTNPRTLHSLQDENLALDTMTGQCFELVANDRPVELRANISATVGVGDR